MRPESLFGAAILGSLLVLAAYNYHRFTHLLLRDEISTKAAQPRSASTEDESAHDEEVDLEDLEPDVRESHVLPGVAIRSRVKTRQAAAEGFLPPIYVKTYGCSHNTSDSEYLAGQLQAQGYPMVDSMDEAALVVINSCTVKNPSQDSFVNMVVRAKSQGKHVVVSGCVPQADRHEIPELQEGVSQLGITQLERVVEVVEETLRGNTVRLLGRRQPGGEVPADEQALLPSLDLPKVRRNPLVEIIPLSTGCLGACTYCKTRHARGKLGSYHPEQILRRVRTAVAEGVQQIWLTSEDTGAYGLDIGTDIAALLEQVSDLVAPFNGQVMVRLGMTNPPYMVRHREALLRLLQLPWFFAFLHVPVQSGSDAVLEAMKREYTRADFDALCRFLYDSLPAANTNPETGLWESGALTLATDIICGFPGETSADHEDTMRLLRDFKFPVLNISQFYARPGTVAARMKRLDTKIVKKRSGEVTTFFESYSTLDNSFHGREMAVWFSESAEKTPHTVGHTRQHVKVLVPRDDSLLGRCMRVRITKAEGLKWHIEGEVIGLIHERNMGSQIDDVDDA